MWQEYATPAAALCYIKSEGAVSTLQQVQIERAAQNSKARNGFEFSFEAPTGGASAKPPNQPRLQPGAPPGWSWPQEFVQNLVRWARALAWTPGSVQVS